MSHIKGLKGASLAAMVAIGASFVLAAPANAVTFDFTFDNTFFIPSNGYNYGVAGSVTGKIIGLSSSGASSATEIDITSVPSGSGLFTGTYNLTGATNSFTVSGGNVLTIADFIGGVSLLGFNWNSTTGGFAYLQSALGCNAFSGPTGCVVDTVTLPGAGSLAFTLDTSGTSTTPLPAALPLFASGLGALGLLGWRRKRKASASAA
jgi:hypothetical protein